MIGQIGVRISLPGIRFRKIKKKRTTKAELSKMVNVWAIGRKPWVISNSQRKRFLKIMRGVINQAEAV